MTVINATVDELKEELKKRGNRIERKIITSVRSADNDQKAQNEIVEEMIDAGDILCVIWLTERDPTTVIRLARQNDIPLSFFAQQRAGSEDLSLDGIQLYVG